MHTDSLQTMPDEKLVRLALCGENAAYNTLMIRFRNGVILVAEQILHSREGAEDVAQEVFLVAFQSLSRIRDPKRFASWLYAIARYRACRVRKQKQHTILLETEHLHALLTGIPTQEATDPEVMVLRQQEHDELSYALAALKPELQLVFRLRYEQSWPVARISEFLSLPVTTTQWRLYQIRKLLKQQLIDKKESEHD